MHACACFGKWRVHLALVQAALTVATLNLSVSNQALRKAAVQSLPLEAARESEMWISGKKKYENAAEARGKATFLPPASRYVYSRRTKKWNQWPFTELGVRHRINSFTLASRLWDCKQNLCHHLYIKSVSGRCESITIIKLLGRNNSLSLSHS